MKKHKTFLVLHELGIRVADLDLGLAGDGLAHGVEELARLRIRVGKHDVVDAPILLEDVSDVLLHGLARFVIPVRRELIHLGHEHDEPHWIQVAGKWILQNDDNTAVL